MIKIDFTGMEFGRWTVLNRSSNDKHDVTMWNCRCECGSEKTISGLNLKSGRSKSCGCLKKELLKERRLIHGSSHSPEYDAWISMRQRCENSNSPYYDNYGGRGITVCERWKESFEYFLQDMGTRQSKKFSLDRIDVNGNYSPENCHWTTSSEQAWNQRKRKNSKAPFRGVDLYKGKWRVRMTFNGERIPLGSFEKLEDAINARKASEIKYWGRAIG